MHEILQSMRSELDEHRSVINENTNEIQTNFEFLCQLDKRIDALQDKINEMALVMGRSAPKKFSIQPLSAREKELFLSILSLTESMPAVTHAQLGQCLGWSASIIGSYLARMQEKGVPLLRKMCGGVLHIGIDAEFRQLQIVQNVVGLEVPLTRWM